MHVLRTTILALTTLLAGVVLGLFLATSDDATEPTNPVPATASAPCVEAPAPLTLAGRGEALGPEASGVGITGGRESGSATDAKAPIAAPIPSDGVFEVLVTDAHGDPVHAQVYALPRDTGDWNDPPETYQEPPGPCRLRIPLPGTYDLFARSTAPPGVAGREDVRIGAGETVRVHLAYEAGRPIRFVPASPWPVGEFLQGGRIEGEIHLVARQARGWRVDKQWRGHAFGTRIPLQPALGPWTSAPLPPSLEVEVQVALKTESEGTNPYGVFPEPAIARAGDTVTLHARLLARVQLRFELEAPDAWPEGPVALQVWLEHTGGVRECSYRWRHRQAFMRQKHAWTLSGNPGAARVRWDGPGITAGVLEGLTLDPERPLEQRVTLQVDSRELPSLEPLIVTMRGLGADAAYEDEMSLQLAALLPTKDVDHPDALWWGGDPVGEIELNHGWRRSSHVVAWLGQRLVSPPTAVSRQGPVEVALEPAGYLVVVPEQLPPEGTGAVRIHRTDDLPFLVSEAGADDPRLRRSALVWVGDRVGPLPAGRHVFEMELMGRRLPDAVIDVKAGRMSVLHIR